MEASESTADRAAIRQVTGRSIRSRLSGVADLQLRRYYARGVRRKRKCAMTLERRLRWLEKQIPALQELVPWIVVVDDDGLVVDDGSAVIERWIGKPPSSLPLQARRSFAGSRHVFGIPT